MQLNLSALTYEEAIELAAKLYQGHRLTEMALAGAWGMTPVTGADREPMTAVSAELRALGREVQKLTRKGRDAGLFERTAPKWNCVDYPDGMHYTPGDTCLWCGKAREQIAREPV